MAEGEGSLILKQAFPAIKGRVTTRTDAESIRRADHPHTRGENEMVIAEYSGVTGPSPHAWGEHEHQFRRILSARTIPTRVGRTDLGWPQ